MKFSKALKIVFSLCLLSGKVFPQDVSDRCFNSIGPLGKFYSSNDIVNLCGKCNDNFLGANLIEWNGTGWLGKLSHSRVERPPPEGCNARALWMGYDGFTSGGEAVALRLAKPLTSGQVYTYTFTYAMDGINPYDPDSLLTFSPIIYTSKEKPYAISQSYRLGRLPATVGWTTQSISFEAKGEQQGHQWLIVHGYETSGSILSNCIVHELLENIYAPNDTTICVGSQIALNAPIGNGYDYRWSTAKAVHLSWLPRRAITPFLLPTIFV